MDKFRYAYNFRPTPEPRYSFSGRGQKSILTKKIIVCVVADSVLFFPSFLSTPNQRRYCLKRFSLILFAGVFLVASYVDARDTGMWAVGGLVQYHQPTGPLNGWYAGDLKLGVNVSYVISPRLTTEVEYHYSKFGRSSLPGRTFNYIGGRQVPTPEADSEMTWNSVASNWLWFFRENAEQMSERKWSPYLGLGLGFYDYSHKVSGLIYPSQAIPDALSGLRVLLVYPGHPDPTRNTQNFSEDQKDDIGRVINGQVMLDGLVPTEDTRTAWTIPVSAGIEGSMGASYGLDFRIRYNLVFGEINPLTSWRLNKAFPIGTLDAGVSFKYYFD